MNPNEPSTVNTQGMLKLFVYGTLKRGFWNHNRFCGGVLDIQKAKVRGRLYEMPSGIPVLQVPDEDIFAHGITDPLADVATQTRLSGQVATPRICPGKRHSERLAPCVGGASHLQRPRDPPSRH